MIRHKMNNGIEVQYVQRKGNLTSFCIGFDAGASREKQSELGLAHFVEHMVFKGTKNRTEEAINKICDEIFGFHNAMTNYPYVIYYGTTMSCDFEKGLEVYSDIVLNPLLQEDGFEEERSVIIEELKEWKDDPYQECEDELFYNAFKKRRIKELIIGNKDSVENIQLEDIRRFYKKYYVPNNCVISVISSLEFDDIFKVINKYFSNFKSNFVEENAPYYEKNKGGTFLKSVKGLKGAKIQYCFPIDELSDEEIGYLKIFNYKFGEGISSILYEEIRTKKGLVYDISSSIKNEKGIKLFTIKLGTSVENVDKVVEIIDCNIEKIKCNNHIFNEENIKKIIKSINLRKELSLERSIELAKNITTEKIMNNVFNELHYDRIEESQILSVIREVLNNPTIQILAPEI